MVTGPFWSVALGGLTYAAYDWAIPHRPGPHDLLDLLGLADGTGERIAVDGS